MTRGDVALLVDYNYWGRDRILEAVGQLDAEKYTRDLGSSFKSIRGTLTHMYSGEWVWYTRWHGESPTAHLPVDHLTDVPALTAAWRELEGKTRAFIAAQDDAGLAQTMSYRLMNGQPGNSVLWQMIQHVVNHGSYHRGQITTMLRQLGATPPKSTDLITFYRERTT